MSVTTPYDPAWESVPDIDLKAVPRIRRAKVITEASPGWALVDPRAMSTHRVEGHDIPPVSRHDVWPVVPGAAPVAVIAAKDRTYLCFEERDILPLPVRERREEARWADLDAIQAERPANAQLRKLLKDRRIEFPRGITRGQAQALLDAGPAHPRVKARLTSLGIAHDRTIAQAEGQALLAANPGREPAWRSEPPSDRQRAALLGMGVDPVELPVNKGEASDEVGRFKDLDRRTRRAERVVDEYGAAGGGLLEDVAIHVANEIVRGSRD